MRIIKLMCICFHTCAMPRESHRKSTPTIRMNIYIFFSPAHTKKCLCWGTHTHIVNPHIAPLSFHLTDAALNTRTFFCLTLRNATHNNLSNHWVNRKIVNIFWGTRRRSWCGVIWMWSHFSNYAWMFEYPLASIACILSRFSLRES